MTQNEIWAGSKSVKAYAVKYGKLPNYVTISNVKYSMPEYTYLVSKTITYKRLGYSSSVNIKWNVKNPTKPSGSTIRKTLSKNTYYLLAKKNFMFMDKYNTVPNYISSSFGKVQYQTATYGFARIGAYIGTYKKIPSTLSLSISKSSSLNKYKPTFTRTSSNPTPKPPANGLTGNKNAIWVHSGDMLNVNLDQLVNYGIGNIFIHEDIFKNKDKALNWISTANQKGLKIHIWFTTFHDPVTNVWVNPIKSGALNQAYFNTVINRAKEYAALPGLAGIHLDYLRYPGSDNNKASIFSYSGGDGSDAITEFVRQLTAGVKGVNSKISVSAAVMPEKDHAARYYGQNATKLGKYLDVIVPMIYEGNYGKNNAWIQSTSDWYVKNSGNAEVWGGLQGYIKDGNYALRSVAELTGDVQSVFAGGAQGVAIFRWGTANLFSLLGF